MKVLIATFSQTGTTEAVAEVITAGFESTGATCTHIRIGRDAIPDVDQFDLIGIGSPAYVFRPPFAVTDFLKSLSPMRGKPFFTFVLYGTYPGATGNRIRRRLRRKGGVDLGYFKAAGADRFIGYLKAGVLFSPGHPDKDELEAARSFASDIAERVRRYAEDGTAPSPEPYDPATPAIYALERSFLNRLFVRSVLSRGFSADDNCTSCGICVDRCPTDNISLLGPVPSWGRECLLCGTCEMVCPVGAVHSPYDWAVNRAVVRLNIWRAKRAGIPSVRLRRKPPGA